MWYDVNGRLEQAHLDLTTANFDQEQIDVGMGNMRESAVSSDLTAGQATLARLD